jgi:hypothetical protein
MNQKFQICKCIGCTTPYVQKIDNNIIWFEIPKNGSSSIKEVLEKTRIGCGYDGITNQELKQLNLNEYNCYSIIRNPYDRFLSAYNQFVLNKRLFDRILNKNNLTNSISDVIDNIHLFGSNQMIHHFYSQTYFVTGYEEFIKFVPIENIDEFFKVLGNINSNKNHFPNRKKRDTLTDIEKEKIYSLYKEDFDNFNFKKI